jgi:thiamine kinase-like enzyme
LISQQWRVMLQKIWQQEFPGQVVPQKFDFIWERSDQKVLLYVFADRERTPAFFGKSTDSEFVAKRFYQEAEVLKRLKKNDQFIAKSIPQPVFCSSVENQTILLEKMIFGSPLSSLIKSISKGAGRRAVQKHFQWVTEWTIRFHQNTTAERFHLGSQGWKDFFRERRQEFNRKWRITSDPCQWEEIDKWLEKCEGFTLPKVIDHGDLTPHQILVTEKGYIVIDWELSPFLSLPCHDLINFFVHYSALAKKRKTFMERDLKDQDITSLFLEGNRASPYLEYLRRYFLTMQIHPYFIIPILYVRYPKIYLDERVGTKIVEVLSAD